MHAGAGHTYYFVILSVICRVLDVPLLHVNRFRMDTGSLSIITPTEMPSVYNDNAT